MKKKKASNVFEKIAARDGVSVAEVRGEIQKVIDIGFASANPTIREQWSKIPYRGKRPTPEEVVIYLVKQAKSKDA